MGDCVYQDVQDHQYSKDSFKSQNKPGEVSVAFKMLSLMRIPSNISAEYSN